MRSEKLPSSRFYVGWVCWRKKKYFWPGLNQRSNTSSIGICACQAHVLSGAEAEPLFVREARRQKQMVRISQASYVYKDAYLYETSGDGSGEDSISFFRFCFSPREAVLLKP